MTKNEQETLKEIALKILALISTDELERKDFKSKFYVLPGITPCATAPTSAQAPKGTVVPSNVALQFNKNSDKSILLDNPQQNEKEIIEKMLIDIKGVFISKRPRNDGRYYGYLKHDGKRHYFYGKKPLEVAEKISHAFKNGVQPKKRKNGPSAILQDFTIEYFEKFRKRKVTEDTYRTNLNRLKNHIFPALGKRTLRSITPTDCQNLIDQIEEAKKFKTVDEVFSLLNVIFKGAIAHDIINKNPMQLVFKETHENVHGVALTPEEIASLKKEYDGTDYITPFMLMLYAGLRPNEVATVRIEGKFIVAKNSKRKTKKIVYFKKIPILPYLEPYLTAPFRPYNLEYLRKKLKKVLPSHKIYDLRTTFYSKCRECGVAEPARNEFMGHGEGALKNAYTSLSDSYLLKEAKKIRF